MLKTKIFVFILLTSLFLSVYPAQAQIVHEDPDRLPVKEPYDADQKLAAALEEMFGSLDRFVAHINASDFEASRQDIRLFAISQANFAEAYGKASHSGTDMEEVAETLASMPDDLWAMVNSSEAYDAELAEFLSYTSASDMANARRLAARMQVSYGNVSESLKRFTMNTTSLLRMLGNSSVDTRSLENGIMGINGYTAKVNESNQQPSGLLGNTSLTLMTGSREVVTGDSVTLTAALRVINGIPEGRLVRFYVDDRPVGSTITDGNGVCSIIYQVSGGSFNRVMVAHAELDPEGGSLSPASSNLVEITRRSEQALLQVHVSPGVASYADTINVYGTLTTLYGIPAAGQTVTISIAGAPAGNATTGEDGRYSYLLAIRHETPAGECLIQSAYEDSPDSALLGTVSPPCIVRISSDVSTVTLDLPRDAYSGGETAVFSGTLQSGDGKPVTEAEVCIFAGGVLIGTNLTDAGGRFSISAPVPFNITAGDHGIHASFDPGTGRALAGSQSEAFNARFEPAVPRITVHGFPLIAFPGDGFILTGFLMTDEGEPIDGGQIAIGTGTATTDATGSYSLSLEVTGGPGINPVTVSVRGDGLLSGTDCLAGIMLVMPFDRTGTAVAVIALLLAACLVIPKVSGMRRRQKQPGKQLPRPAVTLTPHAPVNRPAAFSFAEELKTIDEAISTGNDHREAIRSIYLATKRMLCAADPALPESVTHRELYHLSSDRRPSLSRPLEIITNSYEGVVFGHYPPTAEDVYGSLYSLGELRKQLYSTGGFSS